MTTVTEALMDEERMLLVVLATEALVRIKGDPEAMRNPIKELEGIIRKISGVDTRLIAERAYPSRA